MKRRNKGYYMFSHIPESAAGARSILATTTLLGKHILIVWFNCCSECSHDNEKEGKELGKVRGRQPKVNKNCWEERRRGRDVPSAASVLSGWFSWAWDIPSVPSLQGSFLSNCSSCSSSLSLGRAHWGMESSFHLQPQLHPRESPTLRATQAPTSSPLAAVFTGWHFPATLKIPTAWA